MKSSPNLAYVVLKQNIQLEGLLKHIQKNSASLSCVYMCVCSRFFM